MIRFGVLVVAVLAVASIDAARADDAPQPRTWANFCSGPDGGAYQQAAEMISNQATGVQIKVYRTKGSVENVNRMLKGDCDLAIVQSDVLGVYADTRPETLRAFDRAGTVFREYVHLICNNDSGISGIRDLKPTDNHGDGGTVVAIGDQGSGSVVTWEGIVSASKKYENVPTIQVSDQLALTKVMGGEQAACMITVSALNTSFLKRDAGRAGDKVHLAEIDDSNLAKLLDERKRPVYTWSKIPGDTYPDIQHGWFSSAVGTVSVDAVVVARTDWYRANQRQYEAFLRGLNHATPRLKARFGQ